MGTGHSSARETRSPRTPSGPRTRSRGQERSHQQGFTSLAVPTPKRLDGSPGVRVPTVFVWDGGGRDVYVTGTFNNWSEKIPMTQTGDDFTVVMDLPPGKHQYKFVVDGKWECSSTQPLTHDSGNNVNNVREVRSPSTEGNTLDLIASPPAPDAYHQQLPNNSDHMKEPPALPPHMYYILLNTDSDAREPSVLPIPQQVTLNHVYRTSYGEGARVMVLGITSRYKTKFVTTVLYKPVPTGEEEEEEENEGGNGANQETRRIAFSAPLPRSSSPDSPHPSP